MMQFFLSIKVVRPTQTFQSQRSFLLLPTSSAPPCDCVREKMCESDDEWEHTGGNIRTFRPGARWGDEQDDLLRSHLVLYIDEKVAVKLHSNRELHGTLHVIFQIFFENYFHHFFRLNLNVIQLTVNSRDLIRLTSISVIEFDFLFVKLCVSV